MTAADTYAARIDAVRRQRDRIRGQASETDRWAGPMARRFRADPHRPLDPNLEVIAGYILPDEVLVDVGGGAGRLSLPLASRCKEIINVDPSPGMGEEFVGCAADAGITNARLVQADWMDATDVDGDVALVANVTYFVHDIVPFVEKLQAAARRLVMIVLGEPPPPLQNSVLYEMLHGEEQEPVPGMTDLLPVLWQMGILPDVRLMPVPFAGLGGPPPTREGAIEFALQAVDLQGDARARMTVQARFSELYEETPDGFRPLWRPTMRQVLVAWRPDGAALER